MKKRLLVVPARKGSKRIKNKNIINRMLSPVYFFEAANWEGQIFHNNNYL